MEQKSGPQNLSTAQFLLEIRIHTHLKTTTLFFLEHLVQCCCSFLKWFSPPMAKMYIISVIYTVDEEDFLILLFLIPICYIVLSCIIYWKIKKNRNKNKTLTANYSSNLWDHLTTKMSSRIWFLLVILQTYVGDPHPLTTCMAKLQLVPELLKSSCS